MATLTDLLKSYSINNSGNHYTFKADDVVSNINQLRSAYAPTLTDDDLSAAISKVAAADKKNIADAFGSWTGGSMSETETNPWDRYYYSGTAGWNAQTNYVDLAARALKEAAAAKGIALPENFDTQLKPYIDADTQRFEQIWDTRPGKDSGGFVFDNALPFFAAMTLGNLGAFAGLGGAASGGAGAAGGDALAGGFAGDILGATGGADLAGMAGAGGTGWITGSEGLGSAIGGGPLSITGSIPGGSQNMQNLWQAAQNGGGATGGNMDWWTELGLSPADVGLEASPWTTNPGMSDLTGGVLNNAGSVASQNILQQLAGKVGPQQAQSLFQRFMGGDASALDVLGAAAPGLLQEYFRQQQSGDLMAIANQARADRSPFLQYAKDTLAGGPEAFATGAGAGALQGVLAKLSASGGNPMGSPTSLGIATDAALNNWGNDWRQAANIGLGGNYSGLAQNAVMAGGAGSGFGDAAASVFGKQDDLASLLKRLQGSGVNLGGMSLT